MGKKQTVNDLARRLIDDGIHSRSPGVPALCRHNGVSHRALVKAMDRIARAADPKLGPPPPPLGFVAYARTNLMNHSERRAALKNARAEFERQAALAAKNKPPAAGGEGSS